MYIQRSVGQNVFTMYDPDMSTFRETYPGEEYEPGVCRELANCIHTGDAFLDIGALYGYFSLYAKCLNNTIPIYAFEPNKYYFEILKGNIQASSPNNICCLNVGLGESTGKSKISEKAMSTSGEDHTGDITFLPLPKLNETNRFRKSSPGNSIEWLAMELKYRLFTKKPEPHKIDIINFDEWMETVEYSNMIAKIDIHGAETLALRGMRKSLHEGRFKKIFLEVHKPSILLTESYEEIFEFFDTRQYKIFEIINYRSSKYSIRALSENDIKRFCKYSTWSLKQKIDMRMLIVERI